MYREMQWTVIVKYGYISTLLTEVIDFLLNVTEICIILHQALSVCLKKLAGNGGWCCIVILVCYANKNLEEEKFRYKWDLDLTQDFL